ncbi:MAG: glycosyl transferase [Rhodobacteraceae bacterium]|nr:MAG: glycosyl transferase [Paracoccaceae bacterium]
MAQQGSNKPPLVAPMKHFDEASTKKSKSPKSGKPNKEPKGSKRPPKASRQKRPARGGVLGFVTSLFGMLFRSIWWVGLRAGILLALIVGGWVAYYYKDLPQAVTLMDDRKRGSVTLQDRYGEVFAWRGDQFGGLVSADTVSPHLKNAVVATEDKRFYRHFGISPRGILGAIRINMRAGRSPLSGNGGSTITQQVAKRVFFSDLPSMERKIKEVPMSIALELKYTKNDILGIYMNRAYLGAGSYGFEAASQRYFAKSARQVSVSEAAMLAGLLKAPSKFAPTRNMARAQNRANLIIGLMEDQDYLSAGEAISARNNPAKLSAVAEKRAGGYFADWIMESGPDFILKDSTEDLLIKTTFDGRIQKAAEDALEYIFEHKVRAGSKAQAAIVVMSKDGAVRGLIGGRNLGIAGGFNRATQALRQTGSSFKPFVYAAALENGYQYDSIVMDEPLTLTIPGSGKWSPKNYTRTYKGPITFTEALRDSVNTAAVRISETVGREKVRVLAQDFGIRNKIAQGPALALGASESTLLEMTGAYAGILNSGVSAEPFGVIELTIQGEQSPLMGKSAGGGRRVINDHAAAQLTYMMHQVVEAGTGRRARLNNREAAGKTGTTQGARDAWFIGFTADYVTGVWMGYDNNSKLTGVTGGGLPADIWRETMERVHAGMPSNTLNMIRPLPESLSTDPEDEIDGLVAQNPRRNGQQLEQEFKRKIDRELQRLEKDAETILNRVLGNLFGKRN